MPRAKAKGLLWALAGALIAACCALGLPAIARHVPWRFERWLDHTVGTSGLSRPCRGDAEPGSLAAFGKLLARIYPLYPEDRELPITVDVLPGASVNAFAVLGGHIHVFDGLLQKTESPDELAGVIAHEIEHVRGRHIMQGLAVNLFTLVTLQSALPSGSAVDSRVAYTLLNLKFSRKQESEADEQGLLRLRAAGVDAAGFGRFFARAQREEAAPQWLSSHPANAARADLARRAVGYPVVALLSEPEWRALVAICR